jgi:2-polyprenyl-3-methyl-5-hydroxy-6-metoxy-1,4-benzoquinol methylase
MVDVAGAMRQRPRRGGEAAKWALGMSDRDYKLNQAQGLATRLFAAGLATAELMTAYIGARLGLYEALASAGPLTAGGLAERAGIATRYALEWLEQQAACGILEVDDPGRAPEDRLYLLPEGHREALTNRDSIHWIAPMALLPVGSIAQALPDLLHAYRTGTGLSHAAFGSDYRGDQSAFNRGVFLHLLPRWIRTLMPDVHAALSTGIQVADLGCGLGWSSISLARAYPQSRVYGFDIDAESIALAQQNAREVGLSDRLEFEVRDAREWRPQAAYGLVCILDALHDMPAPVPVLRACAQAVGDSGSILLMEPNAAERFSAPAGETERFLYAISVLHCLPIGLAEQPSAATGTVMRPDTVRAYAEQAGFSKLTMHAVDHRFYRLYRLAKH